MIKKLILILMTLPFLGFGQSKTEKVATQVGAAAVVTAGVIGLFKKKKDKNNTTEAQNTAKSKTTANPDGTYPVNTKPEEILFNVYKCSNYKDFEVEVSTNEKTGEIIYQKQKHCVWKPSIEDYGKIDEEQKKFIKEQMLTFATKVDTVMTFTQNGIKNIVIATLSSSFTNDSKLDSYHATSAITGIIRLQATDEKNIKLISNNKIMMLSGAWGKPGKISILQIDDENIFYEMSWWDMHQGNIDTFFNYYDLSGNLVMDYQDYDNSGGFGKGGSSETKMNIDKMNKIIKLTTVEGKRKKTRTFQYGNGTITEIKQPVSSKNTTKKK